MYRVNELYPLDYIEYFENEKILISTKHNFAFTGWEIARLKGFIEPGAQVVHVDSHIDDIMDGIFVEGIKNIKTVDEAIRVGNQLDYANFIWAGFGSQTIKEIIHVSDDYLEVLFNYKEKLNKDELNDVEKILDGNDYKGKRVNYISEIKEEYLWKDNIILDLDLDYFVKKKSNGSIVEEVMDDVDSIRHDLTVLKNMRDWNFITVALEPLCCGGDDNSKIIFDIFKEVFGLDGNKGTILKIK